MKRRTRRLAVVTVGALALVAVGGFVDGALPEAGAAISDPVAPYLAGEVQVFGSTHRNASCSVTRNVVNLADGPRRVIQWVTWDGHLEPVTPQPGTSAMDGDEVLAAGESSSITFTNDGHISPTASGMRLHTLVLIPDGVAQVGAQVSEAIEPCRETPAPSVPPVASTVPTVESTVPVPVPTPDTSVTVPAPDTTSPPPVVSGPAPSATQPVEVLTQQVRRGELPSTGASTPTLIALGAGLLITGASVLRGRSRLTHGEDAK